MRGNTILKETWRSYAETWLGRAGTWRSHAAGLAIVVAGVAGWQAQPMAQQRPGPNLENMFIDADTDAFDPGLAVGAAFPPIRALHQGEEIDSIDRFMGERGAIFIANRSADW